MRLTFLTERILLSFSLSPSYREEEHCILITNLCIFVYLIKNQYFFPPGYIIFHTKLTKTYFYNEFNSRIKMIVNNQSENQTDRILVSKYVINKSKRNT